MPYQGWRTSTCLEFDPKQAQPSPPLPKASGAPNGSDANNGCLNNVRLPLNLALHLVAGPAELMCRVPSGAQVMCNHEGLGQGIVIATAK